MNKLQMTVHVDPLTESNCYILSEKDRCVIIDPGDSRGLFRILEQEQLEPELILLTHEHCDHMAGLDALREKKPMRPSRRTPFCSGGDTPSALCRCPATHPAARGSSWMRAPFSAGII